jgi:hypothetical protein
MFEWFSVLRRPADYQMSPLIKTKKFLARRPEAHVDHFSKLFVVLRPHRTHRENYIFKPRPCRRFFQASASTAPGWQGVHVHHICFKPLEVARRRRVPAEDHTACRDCLPARERDADDELPEAAAREKYPLSAASNSGRVGRSSTSARNAARILTRTGTSSTVAILYSMISSMAVLYAPGSDRCCRNRVSARPRGVRRDSGKIASPVP